MRGDARQFGAFGIIMAENIAKTEVLGTLGEHSMECEHLRVANGTVEHNAPIRGGGVGPDVLLLIREEGRPSELSGALNDATHYVISPALLMSSSSACTSQAKLAPATTKASHASTLTCWPSISALITSSARC